MGDSANYYHDVSVTPRRYLSRQWKKNKPHLPPSDSLPALRLCPSRPLFVCAQCGFANAWIPLCLWCEWTSAEATRQFEAGLPRPRRLSAPSRTVPSPKKTRQRMSASSTGPHTPKNERTVLVRSKVVPGITTVLEAFHRDVCRDEPGLDPHNVEVADRGVALSSNSHRVQKEEVDGGVRRVATATSITPPLPTCSLPKILGPKHDSEDWGSKKRDLRGRRRRLPALFVQPPATRFRASCPAAERMGPESAMTTPAKDSVTSVLMGASSTPRSTGSMDMSDGGHMMHSTRSSISSSQCCPTRGLRRTQNMTLLPVSPRSRSPLRASVDVYPASAVEARHSLTPCHDADGPPVRLGHPSRPYYSAIRKDMSRPTSPVFSITAPRTPSPIPSRDDYVPRGTKSLDCASDRSYGRELRPMSMGATSPTTGAGFSLSGEMELRMNLARWRREDASDEPGGYHFRETSRSPTRANMKRRVKQLGKGLKDLVLGRSS